MPSGVPERYLTLPVLDSASGVSHAFTTRRSGQGARTNGLKLPDDWTDMAGAFGIAPEQLITVNQVHGEDIVKVERHNHREMTTVQADALITEEPGLAVGVETADCVPILLLDPKTPAVAAIHAGWRSTVKMIVKKSVIRMIEEFGSDPSTMIAAIGPAICGKCYEVDEPVMGPVREAFTFWKEVTTLRGKDRWGLDLVKANKLELMQSGLAEGNIHSLGLCTSCRRDLFYSYRAEGRTGRMLSAIMIKP